MIRAIDGYRTVWKQEAANTKLLFDGITDASLHQAVSGEHRDIGRIAWHITTTIGEMMSRTGLHVDGPAHDAPVPTSAREIAEAYATSADSLERALTSWTDETLQQTDEMYGETWTRALTLQILLLHQTHHRGQLTVLMRQAGLPVPGMYGPAKEEWSKFGMPTPTI